MSCQTGDLRALKGLACSCFKDKNSILNEIVLYNETVEKSLRIDEKKALTKASLSLIFRDKISSLLYIKPLKFTTATKFDLDSNKIILSYLNGKKFQAFADGKLYPSAKIINYFYQNGSFEFNKEEFFCKFAAAKIALVNPDKNIKIQNGIIYISQNGAARLALMTVYKDISDISELYSQIARGFKLKISQNLPLLYIIFPRNSKFKRHIEVKSCFKDLTLKLVPYTIINNKGKRC